MISDKICRGRTLRIAVGITVLVLLLAGGAEAMTTFTVNASGGANYTRIQDAIDNASAGDTILVYSGTYYENVNVSKQLILRGIDNGGGMPVVDANGNGSDITTPIPTSTATPPFDANGNGSAITLSAGNSTLEGFKLMNAANWPNAGIRVTSNNNNIIINNASNNNYGIYLTHSNNNTLTGNSAPNNGCGIDLEFSSDNMLIDNIASNSGCGIGLGYSGNNTLTGNNASSNNYNGIGLYSSSNNTLTDNNASSNNNAGIYLYSSSNTMLIDNSASNNYNGIFLGYSSNNNTLTGNNANSNNYNGIRFYSSSNNTLTGNSATNNDVGIYLDFSSDNIIYNNFFNNTYNILNNGLNKWNITRTNGTNIIGGPYLGGNVWATPGGIGFSQTFADNDKDGICDSPYSLDGSNIDYLPLSLNNPSSSLFSDVYSDRGLDTDSNGLYDYLVIDVGVNVSKAGYYSISGSIYNSTGWYIDYISNYTNLDAGNQTVQLRFSGARIWQNRMSGTFDLRDLSLRNASDWSELDYRYLAYTTMSYNYSDFRPQAVLMSGIKDYGLDTDSNALYDYLVVEKQINVTTAGSYEIDGYLYNSTGYYITSAYNYTTLGTGVQNITMKFSGVQIYRSNSTGNFSVDMNLYGYTASGLSASIQSEKIDRVPVENKGANISSQDSKPLAVTSQQLTGLSIWQWFDSATDITGYYSYAQFERSPALFNDVYSDRGLDTDSNGLYDYLVIDAGVNVSKAGYYSISGNLYNSYGSYIDSISNYTNLEKGNQTVQLKFSGTRIWTSRTNGTFDLRYLYLNNASDPIQLDYRNLAYTTISYNYTQFERPPALFNDVYSDRGLDTDGNGFYNYVVIDVGVNVSKAGYYSISGSIYNSGGWYDYINNNTNLDAGNQTVQLKFSGKKIWQSGTNSTFDLRDLSLSDWRWGQLDYRNLAYTTKFYNYSDFRPLVLTLAPVSLPESRYVWDAALGANLTYTWTPMNFDGFFYDVNNNAGNESLRIKLDSYSDRTIDMGDLIYTTAPEEVSFSYSNYGKYKAIGFMGEKYFAGYIANPAGISTNDISTINSKQLHKVLLDDDTQRAVYAGSTLTLNEGYVLKVTDVNITGGRMVLLTLLKDGTEVNTTSLLAGQTYVFTKRAGNVSDLPIIAAHIESVFSGMEASAAFIKGIFQISESYTSVNTGNRYGIMEITGVSDTGITMENSNPLDLTRGSTIDIMGYLKFRVADSNILRFYPINSYYYGYYSDDYERGGAVSTVSNNITAWDALNFAGFWYDLDTGFYSESLKIFSISDRVIQQGSLNYTTNAVRIPYIVTEEKGLIPEGTDGTYLAVGWGGEKQVAINGKINKLSKIILEHRTSTSEKKTLTAGETWDIGEGWMLTAQSIDARATPRQAWLVLSKDGIKKDDRVIPQGQVYTYAEKSLAGEPDVPLFVTYVDSVFAGYITDMVQLRYTWLASGNVTEINTGGRFGVFSVTEVSPGSIILKNDDSLSLIAGSNIPMFGTLNFTVADAPELRFYPSKTFKAFISSIPAPISISINDGAAYTNKTLVGLTLSAPDATEMSFRNESYRNWTPWEPFTTTKSWMLNSGDGPKAIYFKARNGTVEFMSVGDDIILDTTKPEVADLSISTFTPRINEPVNISVEVGDANLLAFSKSITMHVRSPGGYLNTLPMIRSIGPINEPINAILGTYYYNFTNTTEYGRYDVSIIATDPAGNINESEKIWFVTTMPPYVNHSVNTTANIVTAIDASEKANTTIELVTSSDTTGGAINITMSNDIPPEMSQSFILNPLGKYISINATIANLTWIKIKLYYTQAELDASGLDEASLKISWCNESADPYRWDLLSPGSPAWVNGAGVETADINGYAGYVWVNISHFSTFALVGNKIIPPPPCVNCGGSGGGGGGGGGGGASGENFSNVIVREKYDEAIFKDKVTSYKFKNASNPITHVNVTGKVNAGLITAMIEVLKGTSTLVKEPAPGIVNKNVNLWLGTSGFAVPKNLKEVVVRFRVENSWIQSNNVDARDVKLLRWDSTSKKWMTLKTEVKEKDGTNTYFEATTNSLSPLAISAVASPPGGPVAGAPPVETPPKAEETPEATLPRPKGTPGFEISAAMAALSALYMLWRKRR